MIILVNENSEGTLTASVYNYDRGNILWILIALFLGVLCLVGGKKGVTSAAGLIFTFVCILFLYLPLMYIGVSPFGAATLTAVLVTVVVMFLIGGWSYKTLCSILGTIAGGSDIRSDRGGVRTFFSYIRIKCQRCGNFGLYCQNEPAGCFRGAFFRHSHCFFGGGHGCQHVGGLYHCGDPGQQSGSRKRGAVPFGASMWAGI